MNPIEAFNAQHGDISSDNAERVRARALHARLWSDDNFARAIFAQCKGEPVPTGIMYINGDNTVTEVEWTLHDCDAIRTFFRRKAIKGTAREHEPMTFAKCGKGKWRRLRKRFRLFDWTDAKKVKVREKEWRDHFKRGGGLAYCEYN